jgi:CheY-like chemotaxis protein/cell division septation protein DedD
MKDKKKVLIIDDDAEDCALISQALEPHGLEVTTHRDARTGFEAAMTLFPDLVFIKLLLPGTNGLKVSKAIHSEGTLKHVPLVVIVSEQGELDPKYTTTIGIVDILVRPFKHSEIIAKAAAYLGGDALIGTGVTPVSEPPVEERIFVTDDDDETGDTVRVIAENDLGRPHGYQQETGEEAGSVNAEGEDGEASLQGMPGLRGLQKGGLKEQDLFSGIPAFSGRAVTVPRDEDDQKPSPDFNESGEDFTSDFDSSAALSTSPVRRVFLVMASIVAGIAVGVGGYLFFTAGARQGPAQKQITQVLPGPAPVPQTIPATPPEKPEAIPEIPVKQDLVSHETASQKESTPQETASSAEKAAGAAPATLPDLPMKSTPAAGRTDDLYIVQAGVFGKKDNADALAEKIMSKGFAASVKNVDSAGKETVYRVIAGTFTTREQAVETSASLSRKGIKTIVRKQ